MLLLATGSEVSLCVEAYETAQGRGDQGPRREHALAGSCSTTSDQAYRDQVLPPDVTARVSVEQASTFGWAKYVGDGGESIGMRTFGASAPLKDLLKEFGFTAEKVADAVRGDSWPSVLGRIE